MCLSILVMAPMDFKAQAISDHSPETIEDDYPELTMI
jgi:hypothetical protein